MDDKARALLQRLGRRTGPLPAQLGSDAPMLDRFERDAKLALGIASSDMPESSDTPSTSTNSSPR